jgi:hypothetical protein
MATLPVLLCEVPGIMNDDFMHFACFKATINPLKFLTTHRSTFFFYFLKPYFNIILPTSHLSSKLPLSSELSNQNHAHSSVLHPSWHIPQLSQPPHSPNNICSVKVMKLDIMEFFSASGLCPDIFLST